MRTVPRVELELPLDEVAEFACTGQAIVAVDGAAIACEIVGPEDFYDHRLATIFEAAVRCPERLLSRRIEWVAREANELPTYVEWIDRRPRKMFSDARGVYARRVAFAARRRRLLQAMLDEFHEQLAS